MPTVTSQPRWYRPARAAGPSAGDHRTPIEVDHRQRTERVLLRGGHRTWIRAARVRQWTKNVLVFGAPAAAAVGGTPVTIEPLLITYVVFCLLATGTYLVNDVHDADEDRRHPLKRHRPVASGALAPERALIAAAACVLLGLALAITVNGDTFFAACAYVLLNGAYTMCLRGTAIAELAAIAGAFVIRAIAGAAAAGIPTSGLFIAVVAFAALFVAGGKRYADFLDPAARRSRAVLDHYSGGFLGLLIALACAFALGTYCVWAFTQPESSPILARELTIIPFTIALLRYALIVSRGGGGSPEQILFDDRLLQVLGVGWILMLAAGTR